MPVAKRKAKDFLGQRNYKTCFPILCFESYTDNLLISAPKLIISSLEQWKEERIIKTATNRAQKQKWQSYFTLI